MKCMSYGAPFHQEHYTSGTVHPIIGCATISQYSWGSAANRVCENSLLSSLVCQSEPLTRSSTAVPPVADAAADSASIKAIDTFATAKNRSLISVSLVGLARMWPHKLAASSAAWSGC